MSSNHLVLPSPRDSRGLAVVAAAAAHAASAALGAHAAEVGGRNPHRPTRRPAQ